METRTPALTLMATHPATVGRAGHWIDGLTTGMRSLAKRLSTAAGRLARADESPESRRYQRDLAIWALGYAGLPRQAARLYRAQATAQPGT